jgi:hypothetical protein
MVTVAAGDPGLPMVSCATANPQLAIRRLAANAVMQLLPYRHSRKNFDGGRQSTLAAD